ncbi:hypothetical protein [Streptomyces syringium]|uniref:hypothetical protein n=1 Tax=Streptomyces syringium TaxID=76729 RepID=UPI0037D815BC
MQPNTAQGATAPLRVLLATWGTTGDMVAYTGLASGLTGAGHHVTVVTSNRYTPLFLEQGLRVRALPLDEQEAAIGRHKPRRACIDNGQQMALAAAQGLLDAAREGCDVLLARPLMHPRPSSPAGA